MTHLLGCSGFGIRRYVCVNEGAARCHHGTTPQHYQLLLAVKGIPDRERADVRDAAEWFQLRHRSVVSSVFAPSGSPEDGATTVL